MKALGPLALNRLERRRQRTMKALGPLAVAESDIRALGTARADRADSGD
jgi:hypothetical protein